MQEKEQEQVQVKSSPAAAKLVSFWYLEWLPSPQIEHETTPGKKIQVTTLSMNIILDL